MSGESGIEFREHPDYPGYRFGSDGSVWSLVGCGRSRKPRKHWYQRAQQLSQYGYWTISLPPIANGDGTSRRTRLVHNLILEAFRGPCPPGMEGCHNNGVRADNRLENLRWDTHKNNNDDKYRHNTVLLGERHQNAVLKEDDVREIRELHANGVGYKLIGRMFNLNPSHVRDIVKRKIWGHVRELTA